ncbi:hypothetical protein TWF281_000311 [Arthrobotrys megalospora]
MPRARKSGGRGELIPTQVPTGRTDTAILLTLSKEDLQKYIDREKNCFFRINPWNQNVLKVWIYVKDPVKSVTHVAFVGPLKTKGEVGPIGHSNVAFNSGVLNNGRQKYKAAYEVHGLYKLSREMEFVHIVGNRYSKPIANGNVYVNETMAQELDGVELHKIF